MIGLGTNRLSASRLAGLREARQFRNGQWLEGAGSWFSPYSAAATMALKAAFPAQWAIIRDYGWEHPEIVGYMNAYAVEDAKIAYSLVEGIGTRWLIGNQSAYIQTDITALDATDNFEIYFGVLTSNTGSLFGRNLGYNTAGCFYFKANSNKVECSVNGSYAANLATLTIGNTYHATMSISKFTLDGSTKKTWSISSLSGTQPFFLLWGSGEYKSAAKVSYIKNNGNHACNFVPFIHKDNSVEYYGMIDLLTGTFYGDATGNNGFTISESPS